METSGHVVWLSGEGKRNTADELLMSPRANCAVVTEMEGALMRPTHAEDAIKKGLHRELWDL